MLTAANTNSIMTRARAKASASCPSLRPSPLTPSLDPDQYSQIPFAAKALKILLHDISSSAPTDAMGYEGVEGAESDDGDDEWADDGAEYLSGDKDLDYLSGEYHSIQMWSGTDLVLDMMGAGGSLAKYLGEDDSEDGGDQEGDEDLKDDPIYNLDLHVRPSPSPLRCILTRAYRAICFPSSDRRTKPTRTTSDLSQSDTSLLPRKTLSPRSSNPPLRPSLMQRSRR